MTDLHMHTLLSDGALLPSELARRAEEAGLETIALTDHVDASNIERVATAAVAVCREINAAFRVRALPGVEITHVRPSQIAGLAKTARRLGAVVVVVHGETLVEPVAPGTNIAALEADVDILAHPGLLSEDEAKLAAGRGVCIEFSSRRGHSLGNGRTARMLERHGFLAVLNTDTHEPADLITEEFGRSVLAGAGLAPADVKRVLAAGRERAAAWMGRLT